MQPSNMLPRRCANLDSDVHLDKCKVRHWGAARRPRNFVDYAGHATEMQQKIVLTALGGSTSTGADGITADIASSDDFDQLKTLGATEFTGKIVLFNQKFDKQKANAGLGFAAYRETVGYRERGPQAAAQLGAVAVLGPLNRQRRLPLAAHRRQATPPAFPPALSPPKMPT